MSVVSAPTTNGHTRFGTRALGAVLPGVTWGGLALNDERADGTTLIVTNFSGWYGLPEVTPNDVARSLVDGMAPGPKVIGARDMTLEGAVIGSGRATRSTLVAATDDLVGLAARRDMTVMVVSDPILGVSRQAEVRAVGPLDHTWLGPLALRYTVPLRATDPRLYGTELNSLVLSRQAEGSGRVYPTPERPTGENIRGPYPWRYGSPETGHTRLFRNDGNAPAPLLLTYRGDLGTSRLTDGTAAAILLEALNPGETIFVNSETLVAWGPGGYGRAAFVRPGSRPLTLAPHSTTRLSLYISSGAGSVTVQWRSAWL